MARAGLTAERVVLAAAELADEVGFENVTVSALARGFGVKDASLYSHVRNLQDLRTRVALLSVADFADRLTAAVAGRSRGEALTAFGRAYREFAVAHPGRYEATRLRIDPELLADAPAYRRILDTTYAVFHGYGLAEPDLTDAVRLVRSAFHGFAALESSGGFDHPRPVAESFERGLAALHLVLENWPRTAGPDPAP
ncbi:TetR/AcrR family transcriptional regulator [Kitasatospora sp. NPDC059571]|uniref:TetR/AcrR family transcriptional regulator n=1 Tax=Kitasatospora sp. NPDC059571 TaxID=3346871 RepID=UPI0036C772D6